MNHTGDDFFTTFNQRYKRVLVDSDGNPVTLPVVGDLIGKFQVEKILGRGAMGVVYLCKEANFDIQKAIKIAMPDSGNKDLARLRNEAAVCARLEHPNIVKVFDAGYWKGILPFTEMEFIDGTDLNRLIKKHTTVPIPFAMAVLSILCLALEYAHAQTIVIGKETFTDLVHRDLKPANVLISEKGVVKLTDFGLAKFEKMTDASVSGLVLGTVPYMAPEHQKYGKVSVESDIYSMGVMFYEMVTGKRPFPEGSTLDLEKTIGMKENASYEPLRNIQPKIDPNVEKIIDRCLRPLAKDRYDSYSLLQYSLDSTLENYTKARTEDITGLFINNNQNFNGIVGTIPRKKKPFQIPPKTLLLVLIVGILTGSLLYGGLAFLKNYKNNHAAVTTVIKPPSPPNKIDSSVAQIITGAVNDNKSIDTTITVVATVDSEPPLRQTATRQERPLKTNGRTPAPTPEIPQKATPLESARLLFKNGNFAATSDMLKKIDFSTLQSLQKDSCIVLLIESLYKADNYREAIRIANFYPIADGKYFLLLAFCQEAMGMYNEAQSSYDKSTTSNFQIDKSGRRNAYLLRARFYQSRYEELRVDQLRNQMVNAWRDFLSHECNTNSTECDEARRIVGEKYK